MLITIYVRSICRVWPVIWIVAVHKWNTKTDMWLLLLFCHIKCPDTSMHMYINFNTLHEAGFLMISFFLMDPRGPPSICSLEATGEEGDYEACLSTRRLYLILIERWQLGVAMQLRSVASNRMCSQKKSLEVCGHFSSPLSPSVQGRPKLGRGLLTGFPINSFQEVWAVPSMNPDFFSSSKWTTKRRQPLRSCRSTSFRLGSCPFWRAREWAAWPAMSALKAFGRAATPSCGREVSARVLTKRRNSSQHSLAFRD